MTVRVLFFGQLTDVTGAAELPVGLPEGATVQTLLDSLFERWPALRRWDTSLLTAVNMVYAGRNEVIPDQAEVAVMPPVQGG